MTTLRQQLAEQLARFDDEAYAALANRGLLRRARKDLEKLSVAIVEESADTLAVACGEQRIEFNALGPAHARCTCASNGVCHHILCAAIGLQGMLASTTTAEESIASSPDADEALSKLQKELLAIPGPELLKHAGKAGYRWAWQFVQDLDPDQTLRISGERHLVLSFVHPRIGFRYMGGGIEALIADTDLANIAKYRVAAIIAYQRAFGISAPPPEEKAKPHNNTLDLGKDHADSQSAAGQLDESRQRLRESLLQLLRESVELGLSHLSPGIHERFATLAVWAQGAEYHRLALLLRRIADHVELLLERAGNADEHRLFDELSLACGLVSALDHAASKGGAPHHLVGRPRSIYEEARTLDLIGLGAHPWRAPSGYVGLTMLFWAPEEQAFFSCGDARPENQRNFNPIARYKAPGPWSGLGAPQLATGQRVQLTAARLNAAGRISASESTSAAVSAISPVGSLTELLRPQSSWTEALQSRRQNRLSLLAEAQPMNDWAVLQPGRFDKATFDPVRQTLIWPIFDREGQRLDLELRFDDFTAHAISRIETLDLESLAPTTLVVARIRPGLNGPVGEPLSLIETAPKAGQNPVDALYFDEPKKQGLASKLLNRLKRARTPDDPLTEAPDAMPVLPETLREFKHWLCRQAERGTVDQHGAVVMAESTTWTERAASTGFPVFQRVSAGHTEPGLTLLRLNYVWLQHERLMSNGPDDER